MSGFKAIELDGVTRQRTGREFHFDLQTRQESIDALLAELRVSPEAATVDPTRSLVLIGDTRWSIVSAAKAVVTESASLRRGGAKHKQVR
jgi:predicted phage tail protein